MQGSQKSGTHAYLKCESVWFKFKLVSQFLTFSFLLCNPFFLPYLHAAPAGGQVVGGAGSISQSDLTTTINQTSQNLAVNWQSFNVKANEKVNFIQPNSSSIALNRILGNNGSTIQGQINANGQVILVNPNGVFFTSSATVNVGGMVASSLDMSPADFMNGNYIFNEVQGADGAVINSGIINASLGGNSSTGGNVALIGKQVKNEGLISANLGSVVLAAGKQSVLTFDNQGLIGVKVTKEVLQDEVGLDAAVINSGKINAAGGRVLLTASTSQDVFSQAVNSNVDQATSVVVNPDGSFTLGGGADVLNSGSIDVSSANNENNIARIVLLGENVTSSGKINADVANGNAGEIEIHANNKTLLTGDSITSAQALNSGTGAQIRILGDKVGLFDQSSINASGANGGGEVLVGGDRQGQNPLIRNANFIYLGADTTVNADAASTGNGGKIITFAKDTARIHGSLFARGGDVSGNGGFIETSGLRGFEITHAPDVSASNGNGGLWLIDPYNIEIVNDGAVASTNYLFSNGNPDVFTSNGDSAKIEVGLIANSLLSGDVNIVTGSPGPTDPPTTQLGDIIFNADLAFDMTGGSPRKYQLKLVADHDITFTSTSSITRLSTSDDSLDLVLQASGNISLAAETADTSIPVALNGINLYGGKLDLNSGGVVTFGGGTINTGGGAVDVIDSSGIDFNGSTITTAGGNFVISQTGNVTSTGISSIATSNGNFIVHNATNFDSSNIDINVSGGRINLDGSGSDAGVTGNVILGNLTATTFNSSDLFITKATSIHQATGSTISIANNTDLNVTSGAGTHSIALNESTNDFYNIKFKGSTVSLVDANSIIITGESSVSSQLKIAAAGDITDGGGFTVSNGSNSAIAIFDTTIAGSPNTYGSITLNNNNDFNNVKIINANNVELKDITNGIALEANAGTNAGGVFGNLTVTSTGNGNITDMNGVAVPASVPAATYTGEINVVGDTLLKVKSTNDILLTAKNNTFTGAVDFKKSDTSGKIHNISIVDDTSLQLQTIDITGNLNTTAAGITQDTSSVKVSGNTTLSSSADITLANSNNDFNNVTVLNGHTVSLRDKNNINLLSSATSGDLTIQAGAGYKISLVGDISTNNDAALNAGNVRFNSDVLLSPAATTFPGNTVNINTNASGLLTDGAVTFAGSVDNDYTTTTPRNNLNIITGNGNVDFQGDIGTNANIASLVINKGLSSISTVNLKQVRTRALDASVTTDAIDITAGTINLTGNLETNRGGSLARGVNLTGNVDLGGDITINTDNASTDGNITISGSVNNKSIDQKNLILAAGTADVSISGTAGSSLIPGNGALNSLTVTGNNVTLGNVTSKNTLDITGNTSINLGGNLETTVSGSDILLKNGNVSLINNVTLSSIGSSNITVEGTINADLNTNNRALVINAGSGSIDLQGSIGQTQAIQGLTINAVNGNATLQAIKTRGLGVNINTDTLSMSGNIITTDDSTASGTVILNQDKLNLLSNISINTNSSAGSDAAISILDSLAGGMAGNNNSLSLDSGLGNVVVTTNLEGLSAFDVVSSQTTSLNGVTTYDGRVSVNANTDITLNGNYDSGTANMSFSADNDNNGTGALSLNSVSTYTGNNIYFSASSLTGEPTITASASGTVTFNNTVNRVVLGNNFGSSTYFLSNWFLDKISAQHLQINSPNNYVMLNGAILNDNLYSLGVNAATIYTYSADSQLNSLNAVATNSMYLYKNITAENDISLSAPTLYSYNYSVIPYQSTVTSTTGSINITTPVIAGWAALNLSAASNTVNFTGNTNVTMSNSLIANADVINHGNILAANDINFVTGGAYTQTSSLESTGGSISIIANSGNIGLDYNKTNAGTITVNAKNGSIFDNNGDTTNIESSGQINLTATSGIGNSDPLEIISNGGSVNLNANNTGSGNIELINTGNITLQSITNTPVGGKFILTNNGDVTINSVILNKAENSDATFDITNGNIYAVAGNAKHLTANSAFFYMNNTGGIGQNGTALITDVPNRIEVLGSLGTYIEYYGKVPPATFIGDNDYKNRALQVIENLSAQQLIQVETLAQIDPAIFTDVRNYNNSDVALMMPADQRYTNEDDDDDDAKQKRKKFLNSKKYN